MKQTLYNFRYFCVLSIIILTGIIMSNNLIAQQSSTLYWMQGIPQSAYSNPGFKPDARIYVGMPGLSSIYFGVANTGFKPDDLLKKNNNGTFYIDSENMLSKLKKNNFLGMGYQQEVLAFGFRSKRENYYSFNFSEKVDMRFGYPKDLMLLLFKGNDYFAEQDRKADFAGLGINASHYQEFAFGFSRQWLNELSAGIRAKILFGLTNVNFEKTNLSLYTDPDTYDLEIHTDIIVNTSLSFLDIELDNQNGELVVEDNEDFLPENYLLNFDNFGFAVDLGGVYELDDRFSIGLSVIDLGFISWKSNVNNINVSGNFDFKGVNYDDLQDEDSDIGEILSDSIIGSFEFEQTKSEYRTMLPAKILLSGTFNISEIHKTGLMARGEFYDGSFYPSITAAYSIQPLPAVGASVSYSIIHGNFTNIGFGLHLNLLPLQIYVVTDNFFPSLRPQTIQTTNVHLGLNWVIGYRPKEGAQPLYSW